ncbi:hypothetical protein L7F22_056461 [Adiantum nelumboides]|nr:hypothetical protein [Adiantum nelumboides]
MVFGLSYGEVFLLMVGTVVLLGPKDVPVIARAAGRLTGRAIGYIQTMRSQADTIMQQSQANNMSLLLSCEYLAGLAATKLVHKIENTLDRFADASGTRSNAQAENSLKSSADLQRQATSYARFAGHLHALGTPKDAHVTDEKRTPNAKTSKENVKEIPILPISAVSMGLFPARSGPITGGSDLMLESLAERKVAQQAAEFLQQPTETGNTPAESNDPQKLSG